MKLKLTLREAVALAAAAAGRPPARGKDRAAMITGARKITALAKGLPRRDQERRTA